MLQAGIPAGNGNSTNLNTVQSSLPWKIIPDSREESKEREL
jgi:hypothetical protein